MIQTPRTIRWASIGVTLLISAGVAVYRLRPADTSAGAAT